ncbi:MAG: dipeptidase [Clostridia bacterium]|nr:dipeptidase [Clostridia bacterium]
MQFYVADAHCDYLFGAMDYGWTIDTQKRNQTITLENLQKGGVALQFLAAWADTTLKVPPLEQVLIMIDRYHTMLETHPEIVPLTKDFDPRSDRIATVLAVEGAECLGASPSILRDLYRLGVRAMTFTWNSDNELAGAGQGKKRRGLSQAGREILFEMNRLGIAFDVSHLSDDGIEDALALSTQPIFASHSNCRKLQNAPRCLKDEYIKAIAQKGGVIGINFYGPQLCESGHATIADIVRHISHAVSVGGIDHVCIGSDFDGMQRYPKDLRNPSDLPALFNALLSEGFTPVEVERIAYRNLHDYIVQFV